MTVLRCCIAALAALALSTGFSDAGERGPGGHKWRGKHGTHKHGVPSSTVGTAFLPGRAGYFDTVWPSEHTDLWRSHAVPGAGLPAGFDRKRLTVSSVGLNLPMWGYTRARDEVFVIGGQPVALDTFTRAYVAGQHLTKQEFTASFVGSLLNPSVPYVAKIQPSGMRLVQRAFLQQGSTVNYTGGLLMHRNGFVYAVSRSVLYKIDPSSMNIARTLELPLVSGAHPFDSFWTTYNGLQVVASGRLVLKGYHLLNSPSAQGWLLQVDPDDLSIAVQQQEPVLSARITIDPDMDGKTWLYHVNGTESLRYEITDSGFDLDESWTREYRSDDSPNTQASSQLVFGKIGRVVFADDTLPEPATGFKLYTQPDDRSAPPGPLTGVPAFDRDVPGFNFYMIAGDPFESQVVVYYDPVNGLLSAHSVHPDGFLEPMWQRDQYRPSASPAISPDRDHLYIDDFRGDRDEFVVLRLCRPETSWRE